MQATSRKFQLNIIDIKKTFNGAKVAFLNSAIGILLVTAFFQFIFPQIIEKIGNTSIVILGISFTSAIVFILNSLYTLGKLWIKDNTK